MADECKGCKHEESTNITIHLSKCNYCKRAYSKKEDREIHEDLYESGTALLNNESGY